MSIIPAIDIEVSEDYTDVLCHGTGVTDLQFSNPLSRVVKNVSKAELVAYDLPCRKNTVDDSNDCLDFEMGPQIGRVFVTDPGYGYDRFNPPNLHVVNYRSFDTNDQEKNAPVGTVSYYPPWGNRSISGIRIQQEGDASPDVSADKYDDAGVIPQIAKKDLISFGCDVSNHQLAHTTSEGIITNQAAQKCYMVRASSSMSSDAVVQVDKPFEYAYHIHISRNVVSTATKSTSTVGEENEDTNAITEIVTDGFDSNSPRLFSDKIKLYRAFYRYRQYIETHDEPNIDVLGTQIEMEINYVLGWDVRTKEADPNEPVYDMNDGTFPLDDAFRWDVEFQHSLHVKTGNWPSPGGSPLHSPRYQIRYHNGMFTFVDLFNEPFSLGGRFNAAPLQSQKKMVSNIGFLDMETNDGEYYLSKFLCFGGKYPCVTTIFGILGFAVKNEIPQLSPAVSYTHFNGQQSTLFGYTSQTDAREILKQQWSLHLHARPASFNLSVHKCTARLRHGVYAIGSVIHQNYKRKATNGDNAAPSLEINVRQACDGLIKEVQDQMNIAFHGPGICVQVGDTNNILKARENRKEALHYPLLSEATVSNDVTSIFADRKTPHKFVVTLEDADIYDGTIAQSATNLRSNQNRKTRVRISFSESHGQALRSRTSLRLLNRTGANASRSIANMLGFSSADLSDQQFVSYIPVIPEPVVADPPQNPSVTDPPQYTDETAARYTYGVHAQSTFDTSVRSKSCRIEIGLNQNSSYTPLATAMVAGRTDHANTTCNTDGSVQSFLNEQLRLLGSNRCFEIANDPSKASLYAEPQLGAVISSYIRPVSQNNLNTPVFRAIDWGVRPIVLDKRYNVGELFFRVLDGRNHMLWPCNASETTFFMIRLHHPLLETNQRMHHENRQFM